MATRSYGAYHLLIAFFLVGCGDQSTTVTLPDDVSRNEIFAYDIYHPFQRVALLANPEDVYGEPDDSGSLFETKSSHLEYIEYQCTHGRVRICDGYHYGDDETHVARTLQFFPADETVESLIHKDFLSSYEPRDSGHALVFRGGRDRGNVVLNISNGFVTHVVDQAW